MTTICLEAPVRPMHITSPFGRRVCPITRAPGSWHGGIDLRAPVGEPVFAAAAGTVTRSYFSTGNPEKRTRGYGHRIVLDHGEGVQTAYAHLDLRVVREGERVAAGQMIAHAGNTGASTGPHLHFEVLVRGTAVDPGPFFAEGGA
jgi:murein DD-endopeptidase MepM/ murein hydrolase activator NlpD